MTGCVTSSGSEVDVSNVQKAIHGLEQVNANASSKVYSSVQPEGDWWTVFADQHLEQLESQLPASSLDLQLQLSQYAEMAGRYDMSGSMLKPNVGLNAGYSRTALSADDPLASLGMPTDPFDTWKLGLSASWELDFWGYIKNQNESVHHQLLAKRYLVELARQSLSAELAKRYWLYQQAKQTVSLIEQKAAIEKQKVDLATSRQENGVGTKSSTASATASYQQVLATLEDAKLMVQLKQSDIEQLIGLIPATLTSLDSQAQAQTVAAMPVLPVGIPSDWLRLRPDILAAEQILRASISDVKAAKADFYPRVSLTGNIGVQSIEFSDIGNWDSRQFSIGPTFYLPLFQGGRLEAKLALNTAKSRSAAITYRKVVLNAWHEVTNALRSYSTQYQHVQHIQDSLTNYRKAVAAAQREHDEGRDQSG